MKITLCGSIAFQDKILAVKEKLEKLGHKVKIWPCFVKNAKGKSMKVEDYYQKRKKASASEKWVWDRKTEAMLEHFEKVADCDAVLVCNYDKKGIPGYIGGNTLMEIGLALYLKKKIYFLNQIPELSYKEELLGCQPIILNGNLAKIA